MFDGKLAYFPQMEKFGDVPNLLPYVKHDPSTMYFREHCANFNHGQPHCYL